MAGSGLPGCHAPFSPRVQLDGACDRLPKQGSRCRLACQIQNSRGTGVAPPQGQQLQSKLEDFASSRLLDWIAGIRQGFAGLRGATFPACIAGRGSEQRNAILPKLIKLTGRAP